MMTDLPEPTPAVLADLTRRRTTLDGGSVVFLDDAGEPIFDFDLEGVPYADVRGAARWLARHRPGLWRSETIQTETAPVAAPAKPTSVTELMLAVRSGAMTADEASTAIAKLTGATTRASHVPTTAYNAPSFTALMVRARQGDAAALEALKNLVR